MGSVFTRAARDTAAMMGGWTALIALIPVPFVGFFLHLRFGTPDEVQAQVVTWAIYGLAAVVIVGAILFAYNCCAAPFRIERESRVQLEGQLNDERASMQKQLDEERARVEKVLGPDRLPQSLAPVSRQPVYTLDIAASLLALSEDGPVRQVMLEELIEAARSKRLGLLSDSYHEEVLISSFQSPMLPLVARIDVSEDQKRRFRVSRKSLRDYLIANNHKVPEWLKDLVV